MITDEEIIKAYTEKRMFIRHICRTYHVSLVRVRKVLDSQGLRGGTPI